MLDQQFQLAEIPSQLQLVSRLQHLVRFSSSLTFLSGESGSGKTTLAENLLNQENLAVNQALLSCRAGMGAEEVRRTMLSQLISSPLFNEQDPLGESLYRMLGETNETLLIIIDDAHLLPEELLSELWMLLVENRFQKYGHNINVMLFAAPYWCEQQAALLVGKTDVPPIEIDIPALSPEESERFVRGLFERAGYQARVENRDAINLRIRECNGLPACLQALVDNIIAGVPESKSNVKLSPNILFAALLILVLLGGVGSYFLFLAPKQVEKQMVVEPDVKPTESPQVIEELEMDDNGLPDMMEKPVVTLEEKKRLTLAQRLEQDKKPNPEPLAGDWKPSIEPTPEDTATLPDTIRDSDLELDKKVEELSRVTITDAVIQELDSDVIPTQVVAEITPEPIPSVEPSLAPTPEPVVQKAKEVVKLTTEARLLAISKGHYTLQLSGMSTKGVMLKFMSDNRLHGKAWFYQTKRNNKPWFVVILGDYPNRTAATKGVRELSKSLQQQKPWIKSFKQVHDDLRRD